MKGTVKKSTVVVTLVLIFVVVGVVGVYAVLMGRARASADSAVMTPVQRVLSRDLSVEYPGTVKEVVKYYTEIEKCFCNEDCTEEELERLGMRARELYDEELLAANDVDAYLTRLKADISTFKSQKRRIGSIAVAASTSVDFFSQDGYEFARIYCGYNVMEGNGKSVTQGRVYLLRRDSNRLWKIYGWDAYKGNQ